ncbi:tyrosine-type recombinase/integrase [Mesorhizobium sp. A623]
MDDTASAREPVALSLRGLLDKYGNLLWNEGKHRINVFSFILEADEIIFNRRFFSFTGADLDQIQEALRTKGNSVATINRKTMALSKLLRYARKSGDLTTIPEFNRQEEPEERIRFLTVQEENFLFDRIGRLNKGYQQLSVVLVDTGAKIGELIGLKWTEIPSPGGMICLSRGNPTYERSIPITSRVQEVFRSLGRTESGPFSTIEQHKFRAVWNEAKNEVGLGDESGIVPYILRHTCASRLVIGGVDLRRVQLWLGHRTLRMTLKYDYLSTNDLDIGISVLESAVRATSKSE